MGFQLVPAACSNQRHALISKSRQFFNAEQAFKTDYSAVATALLKRAC